MVNRRTYNATIKRKGQKQTMIYKTLHRKFIKLATTTDTKNRKGILMCKSAKSEMLIHTQNKMDSSEKTQFCLFTLQLQLKSVDL